MKKLISTLLFALGALYTPAVHAQAPIGGLPVNQVQSPAPFPIRKLFFYDGNNNVQYICSAADIQAPTSVSVVATTLTNIVVATNVGTVTVPGGHNLYVGARVAITGSATTALNATYPVATVPNSTTYTIATSGVSDGTYADTTLVSTTSNPRLNASQWAIQVFVSGGPNNSVSDIHYAIPVVGLNQNTQTPINVPCTDRAKY